MTKNSLNPYSDFLLFLFSTSIVVVLLFFGVNYMYLQAIAIVALIASLFLLQFLENKRESHRSLPNNVLLFFLTLGVQSLTIATGGLTSHFLLLVALFAFALSFIRTTLTSCIFLLLFSVLFIVQLVLDTKLRTAIYEDPTVIVLFILVYVFATILTYILNRRYHVKDVFLEVLRKQVKLHEIREETILSGLSELVIITDRKLHIISVNKAVEKTIIIPKTELIGRPIFEHILLKNDNGQLISEASLSIDKLISQKTPLAVHNIVLLLGHGPNNKKYNLTVRPISELEAKVDQILFIIRSEDGQLKATHQQDMYLDQIITKHTALIEGMRRSLSEKGLTELASKAELIGKIDREIRQLLALERDTEDIGMSLVNGALVGRSTYEAMKNFSAILGVHLQFVLEDLEKETQAKYIEHRDETEDAIWNLYTVRTNLFWLEVLLHKLTEIAILLSSTTDDKNVSLALKKVDSNVLVSITSQCAMITNENKKSLFELNYGELQATTNLSLASGLEGYIAKRVSERMGFLIDLTITDGRICFSFPLSNSYLR